MEQSIMRIWNEKENKFHYLNFNDLNNLSENLKVISDNLGSDYLVEPNIKNEEQDPKINFSCSKKDKNGKLIFNGDIIKAPNYPFYSDGLLNYLGIVCYCNKSCSYFIVYQRISTRVSGRAVSANFDEFNDNELEVLGNVYENPELLELKNDK